MNSNKKRIKNLATFNKHQQQSIPCSRVDCFCLSGSASEFQRLRARKSSTGPLKQKTAVSPSVHAHQKVGNLSAGEGSNTEDTLLEVQSPEEVEGASSPDKELRDVKQTNIYIRGNLWHIEKIFWWRSRQWKSHLAKWYQIMFAFMCEVFHTQILHS